MNTKRHWRKAIMILSIVMAVFGLMACTKGESPVAAGISSEEKVIRSFIEAINQNNISKATEFMSSSMVYVENYEDGSQYREEKRDEIIEYVRGLMDNETRLNIASIANLTDGTWEVTGRYTDFLTELLEFTEGIGFKAKFDLVGDKLSSVEYIYDRQDELLVQQKTEGVIGVVLSDDNGKVIVQQCDEGMPADKSGLKAGDLIQAVDGYAVADMKHGYTEARYRIKGRAETEVNLTINRDGRVFDVKMYRIKDPSREGMNIINEYEYVLAYFEGHRKLNDNGVPEDIIGKTIYYYLEDSEVSPREYFYHRETGKLYLVKEGCWFVVNEDYKNLTPQNSDMYKASETLREALKTASKKK